MLTNWFRDIGLVVQPIQLPFDRADGLPVEEVKVLPWVIWRNGIDDVEVANGGRHGEQDRDVRVEASSGTSFGVERIMLNCRCLPRDI